MLIAIALYFGMRSSSAVAERGPQFSAAQVQRGQSLFEKQCVGCHVLNASASPPVALAGLAFTKRWNSVNDLYGIIAHTMPANRMLSLEESQYRDVLAYILSENGFQAGSADLGPDRQAMKAMFLHDQEERSSHSSSPMQGTDEGYFSVKQAERGAAFFQGSCAMCHASEAKSQLSDASSRDKFADDPTYANVSLIDSGGITVGATHVRIHLSGESLLSQWPSAGALYKRIKYTMPAHDSDGLNDETYRDLTAFLLQSNGLRAGPRDLPSDVRILDAMPLIEPGFKSLFNGKDFSGLRFLLGMGCNPPPQGCGSDRPGKTYWIESREIHTTGSPHGYMYTAGWYLNFVLRFDYRMKPDKGSSPEDSYYGNSGYLLFITENRVWPKSLEIEGMGVIQLRPLGVDSNPAYTYDAEAARRAERPVGQWNSVEITSRDGVVTSRLNGVQVSVVTRHEFTKPGHIGFQSEGGRFAWRNLRIRDLDDQAPK